jgi:hypothetical protein
MLKLLPIEIQGVSQMNWKWRLAQRKRLQPRPLSSCWIDQIQYIYSQRYYRLTNDKKWYHLHCKCTWIASFELTRVSCSCVKNKCGNERRKKLPKE